MGDPPRSIETWVLTNGVWDIVHRGHVDYLEKAHKLGFLVVGVNHDDSVRALKGPSRPINNHRDRAHVIASLGCVDWVFVFDDNDVSDVIRFLKPEVWVKSAPYTLETLNPKEVAAAKEVCTEIRIIEPTPGYSSTKIIEAIRTQT